MSDIARFWSRNLRGLNFAEHAVCRELAEFHVAEMDNCYPSMGTLTEIYECSRPYLKRILNRLDIWNLVTRVEYFEAERENRQTSNRYKLNLKRHFPDPSPEGRRTRDKNKTQAARPYDERDYLALECAKQGRRLLKILPNFFPSSHAYIVNDGIREAYYDAKQNKVWLTIEAEPYRRDFVIWLPDIKPKLFKEFNRNLSIELIDLYFKTKPPYRTTVR